MGSKQTTILCVHSHLLPFSLMPPPIVVYSKNDGYAREEEATHK